PRQSSMKPPKWQCMFSSFESAPNLIQSKNLETARQGAVFKPQRVRQNACTVSVCAVFSFSSEPLATLRAPSNFSNK
ncbi:hypothetical protein, partial [Sutterella wadsworthensis]|uniref:hypothetical protein n=2 Tax=Sutterella wadsworthensis TaxID=40545 RepID=UPI003C70501A